jgi:hypothetical protein
MKHVQYVHLFMWIARLDNQSRLPGEGNKLHNKDVWYLLPAYVNFCLTLIK